LKGRPQPLRYLILSDLHIPNHDQRSLAAVEKFMASRKRDGLVYIGDVGNFDVISSHNLGKLRLVEGERLLAEYRAIDEVITRHERIMRKNNPAARIVWLEGNHCFRVTRYLDAHPELEGLVEIPTILKLKERNIEWIASWSEGKTLKLGRLKLHHGFYTCDHAAKKMLLNFGANICFGHTHTVQ
jgi:predicted phosphodiesterase